MVKNRLYKPKVGYSEYYTTVSTPPHHQTRAHVFAKKSVILGRDVKPPVNV